MVLFYLLRRNNMTEKVKTLYHRKGSYFNLIAFIFLLSCWLGLLFAIIIHSVMFVNDPYVGYQRAKDFGYFFLIVFFFIPVSLFLVYGKIGETIIIFEEEISKPMKIKRRKPKIILYEDISWYMKKYSIHTDKLNGVLIMTKGNKKIRYSDLKTPCCSNIIIECLKQKGIKEKESTKNIERYN